jgi:hypothetical protein
MYLSKCGLFHEPEGKYRDKRSHVLERFATVSAELSVHTDNSHPESLQDDCEPEHEQSGRTLNNIRSYVISLFYVKPKQKKINIMSYLGQEGPEIHVIKVVNHHKLYF